MNLLLKVSRVLTKKTKHKFTKEDRARLGVIFNRYGALAVVRQVNALPVKALDNPVGYIEKMVQIYLMENVDPKNSEIIKDFLKD
jgi:hypothetical protein